MAAPIGKIAKAAPKVAKYTKMIDAQGKPFTVVKEGIRGVKGKARKALESVGIKPGMSIKTYDAQQVLKKMVESEMDIPADVRTEVFSNVSHGNGAIYDAIIKHKK